MEIESVKSFDNHIEKIESFLGELDSTLSYLHHRGFIIYGGQNRVDIWEIDNLFRSLSKSQKSIQEIKHSFFEMKRRLLNIQVSSEEEEK